MVFICNKLTPALSKSLVIAQNKSKLHNYPNKLNRLFALVYSI